MPKSPKRNRETITHTHKDGLGRVSQYFSTVWTIVWKIVGGIALAIGLPASVVTFLPRISVDVRPIDPAEPHKTEITIANTGHVSLKNVKPAVGLCRLLIKDITHLSEVGCDDKRRVRLLRDKDEWFSKQLDVDEKYSIRLDDLLEEFPILNVEKSSDFQGADITVIIGYEVWTFPRETEFRFFTRKEKDGRLSWMQRPLVK